MVVGRSHEARGDSVLFFVQVLGVPTHECWIAGEYCEMLSVLVCVEGGFCFLNCK